MDNIEGELSYLTGGSEGRGAEAALYKMLKPDEVQDLALQLHDRLEDPDYSPENLIKDQVPGPRYKIDSTELTGNLNYVHKTKEELAQDELDHKELALRKLFTALQNDTIMYKFDQNKLELHIVDSVSKRILSKVKMPKYVIRSFKRIKKSFKTLKNVLSRYEKDSLNKIFKSYMEKSYKHSMKNIKANQEVLDKQKM